MSATDDLVPMLKKLRLSGVLQSLELRTRQAVEPFRRYDQDGKPGPDHEIELIYDEEGSTAIQAHAALEECSHDVAKHSP